MKKINNHVLSLIGFAAFVFFAFGTSGSDEAGSSAGSEDFLAYSYAEDFVKKKLKAPSTAQFPGTFEKKDHIKNIGFKHYEINSWVDSQNSFGAMIRSQFSCKIKFEGDKVLCEDLVIQ